MDSLRKLIAVFAIAITSLPAHAITFGQPDGNAHPNVGALVTDWDPDSPGPDLWCSGTLVSETLVLTAAHCLAPLPPGQLVWVTFDPSYDEDAVAPSGLYAVADWTAHELFATGGASDAYDIGIVELVSAPSVQLAELPPLGFLDTYSQKELRTLGFTTVGYGTVRDTKTGGPHGFELNSERLVAQQSILSLQPAWLLLSMQPSTGNGGTCYGDSGGPHFLGGLASNLVVSITVRGDVMCRATDTTYRLDTFSAQEFLSRFGLVPAP